MDVFDHTVVFDFFGEALENIVSMMLLISAMDNIKF